MIEYLLAKGFTYVSVDALHGIRITAWSWKERKTYQGHGETLDAALVDMFAAPKKSPTDLGDLLA